jgi:hypothetical protein
MHRVTHLVQKAKRHAENIVQAVPVCALQQGAIA